MSVILRPLRGALIAEVRPEPEPSDTDRSEVYARAVDPKWFEVWTYDADAWCRIVRSVGCSRGVQRPSAATESGRRRFAGYVHHKDLYLCQHPQVLAAPRVDQAEVDQYFWMWLARVFGVYATAAVSHSLAAESGLGESTLYLASALLAIPLALNSSKWFGKAMFAAAITIFTLAVAA